MDEVIINQMLGFFPKELVSAFLTNGFSVILQEVEYGLQNSWNLEHFEFLNIEQVLLPVFSFSKESSNEVDSSLLGL